MDSAELGKFWGKLNRGWIEWESFEKFSIDEGRQAISWLRERKFIVTNKVKSPRGDFSLYYVRYEYGYENVNPQVNGEMMYFTSDRYAKGYQEYCKTLLEKLGVLERKVTIQTISV